MRPLRDKPRDEIERALAGKPPAELIDIICQMTAVEQLFKPAEIAKASRVPRKTVLAEIKAGKFGDYFARGDNSLAVPASGVHRWRALFRVRVSK